MDGIRGKHALSRVFHSRVFHACLHSCGRVVCEDTCQLQPVLYNPSGIVLSAVQQIVVTNIDLLHLRVPSCRSLVATLSGIWIVVYYFVLLGISSPSFSGIQTWIVL